MNEQIATWIVLGLQLYIGLGAVFAVPFLLLGVARIDPSAAEATRGFRFIIAPGVVAFWPLLLRRWWAGADSPPLERNAHRASRTPASRL